MNGEAIEEALEQKKVEEHDAEEIKLIIVVTKKDGSQETKEIPLDSISSHCTTTPGEGGVVNIDFSLEGKYSLYVGEDWNLNFKVGL